MKKLERIRALLRNQSTLALATTDERGNPHSAPLFFVIDDDLNLYWYSSPMSAHSRYCAMHPRVSVSVYRPTDEWRKICGIQMDGMAIKVEDEAGRKVIESSYLLKFKLGPATRIALKRSTLYRFTPEWVRYLDNARRFGFRFEIEMRTTKSAFG